jgi:hypothetical protein
MEFTTPQIAAVAVIGALALYYILKYGHLKQIKGNETAYTLLSRELKSMSNTHYDDAQIVFMTSPDGTQIITLGKIISRFVRNIEYKAYKLKEKKAGEPDNEQEIIIQRGDKKFKRQQITVTGDLMLIEFTDYSIGFYEQIINTTKRILGQNRKYIIYETYLNGVKKFQSDSYFFRIPVFLECTVIGNLEFYHMKEPVNHLDLIINNLKQEYDGYAGIGESIDLGRKANQKFVNASEYEVHKTQSSA